MLEAGDVVLARAEFPDQTGSKIRPAVILFEEMGNLVLAGITSNLHMKGVPITQKEGAFKDGVIKLNYLFTSVPSLIHKKLFSLSPEKKRMVYEGMNIRLSTLIR